MWYNLLVTCAVIITFLDLQVQADFDGTPEINEKKLKEIEEIRTNLNDAFEKDVDMKQNNTGSVIVQPTWTKDNDPNKASSKVLVTEKKLKDTANIRDEIQDAVESGSYAKEVEGLDASKADRYLGLKYRSEIALASLIGAEHDTFDNEAIGFGVADEYDDPSQPNVVQSIALENDIGLDKISSLEMSTRRTREILVLREIVEDLTFDLGEGVREWDYFVHDGTEYFIGLKTENLMIVEKDALKYSESRIIYVNATITCLETFSFWNIDSRRQEGLILVAVGEVVLWFEANSNKVFWKWTIGKHIEGIRYFQIDQKEYLTISTDESSRTGSSSLYIYQFDVRNKEFWIVQQLQLEDPCSEITFLDTGRDVVLAVVQNNSALIYKFNPHIDLSGDHVKFELNDVIYTEGIKTISGFQMGGYSYLALGGLTPQILHYTHGEFEPKTIFGQNFGLVEFFLPVPARTYRDDMILIVQHRVDFESHDLVVLDALIWDGEAFEATFPVPCVIGNHTFDIGVGCLLDLQRDSGIKGSAVLRRHDDIFVIVPRNNAESGLFQIKTELLTKNSDLLDLTEIFTFLKEWVKSQDDIIKEAHQYLEGSDSQKLKSEFSNLGSLQTPELTFDGNIGSIFINDYEWTEEDSKVSLDDLVNEIDKLNKKLKSHEDDSSRNRRDLTYDKIEVENVEIDELFLELLNGEKYYVEDNDLTFDGTVSFEDLTVLDEIRLSSDRSVREDTMIVDEDIQFETINGIPWKNLVDDMIFRNEPLTIEKLRVDGEVFIENDIKIHKLNDKLFPDDYLLSNGPLSSVVLAEKNFLGNLTANAVDTGGLINEVNPFDLITLSDDQEIQGLTTFRQLEVSEKMEVKGSVEGKGFSDILFNPTLMESNIINSLCHFHDLEVIGPVHISGKFNENDLEATLSDVVYRPTNKSEKISINSTKIFNSVEFGRNFHLKDNLINEIPLTSFITKNTDQELDLECIHGNVYFNNLTITGLYDSIDINELVRTTINIHKNQTIVGEIEFEDTVWAQSVNIVESLNGKRDFITLQDNLELDEASFNEIEVESGTFHCDITGKGTFNNVNIDNITQSSVVFVKDLTLENGLEADAFHGIDIKFLMSIFENIDDLPKLIAEGRIALDHIYVNGNVSVNKVNSYYFDEDIQKTVIWLNRPNILSTSLEFEELVEINGDLNIKGLLNEFNISRLVEDIAFKSESPLIIKSEKTFLGDVKVLEDAVIESINGLQFTDIATKKTVNRFQGIVHINGDLYVENLEIDGSFNNIDVGNIGKSYRYDEELNSIVLVGEIAFDGYRHFENIQIDGNLNTIGNVNEFFEDIVFKNNIIMLKGKTTFKGNVTIEKGAYIKILNGYNIMQLMKNIVFINDPDPIVIFAPVSFKEAVHANDVTIKGFLKTDNLMGCSISDWLTDTLRIDREADIKGPFYFSEGVLDGNSIETSFLNGMDMKYIVTLNTPQNLSINANFSDVYLINSITTGGLVNGVNLEEEMNNTLLTFGNQYITTPLTMESCTVIETLETENVLSNNVDLRNLATLNENLTFNSPMSFSKVYTKNVITDDLISGINFTQWQQSALLTNAPKKRLVTGFWTIKDLYVSSESAFDSEDIRKFSKVIKDDFEKEYDVVNKTLSNICQRTAKLMRIAQNKSCFVKYFEKSFSIEEDQEINNVFFFENGCDYQYLIINTNCKSVVLFWDLEERILSFLTAFDSGIIQEMVVIPGKDNTLYLVTNMPNATAECPYSGLNTWHFDGSNVSHVRHYDDLDISVIHHISPEDNKFYGVEQKLWKLFQLSPNSTEKRTWSLSACKNCWYQFLPHEAELGVALVNAQKMYVLNQPHKPENRNKRERAASRQSRHTADSSISSRKEISFSEFRQAIEKQLLDLIRRLNIQLTDINLTVNESPLQDDQLQDYLNILDEIKDHKVLSNNDTLDLAKLRVSSNTVKVLAARVILEVWPVFTEIEKIHNYLRANDHVHHVCDEIFKSLTLAVRDILMIGKLSDGNPVNSEPSNIFKITDRIRDLQKEILQTIDKLEEDPALNELGNEKQVSSLKNSTQFQRHKKSNTTRSPLDEPIIGHAIPETNLLAADCPHLPASGALEIISLKTKHLRNLIAISEHMEYLVTGGTDSVKIFSDVMTGSLFQTISANRPRYLTSIQIGDDSFLAFTEDKNTVRVLIYKGIQGFIEFIKFKTENDIFGMKFINLPDQTNFLLVNLGSKLEFYEAVLVGGFQIKKFNCNL